MSDYKNIFDSVQEASNSMVVWIDQVLKNISPSLEVLAKLHGSYDLPVKERLPRRLARRRHHAKMKHR
jgi:hypothetical protein